MKKIEHFLPVLLAALCTIAALHAAPAEAASRKGAATEGAHKRVSLHQFSGTVTSVDKTSLTVAKAGKDPKTMVFVRGAETRTQGDLEKDAHVTVWYRDDDGHTVAHRVVVKNAGGGATR